MKRNLLTLLTLTAMTAHPALADTVTVYGLMNLSLDSIDNGNDPTLATQGTRNTRVGSNASRIGFKGTEDLGDGLSAIWQLEQVIYVGDSANSSTFGTRNTYGGLKSASLGTLLLGRYDTPYKVSTRKLDVFGEVLADNRTLTGGVKGKSAWLGFDGRQGDTIAYLSPDMGGFSVALAYVAGSATSSKATDIKGAAWSAAATYNRDGLYAALAYEDNKAGSTGTGALAGGAAGAFAAAGSSESAWKVGLGYTVAGFSIGAEYEKTRDNLGGTGAAGAVAACTVAGQDCYGHQAASASAKYSFGNDAVKLAYTQAGKLAGAAAGKDTGASQVSLGYDHSFNKATTLYALYTRLSNGKDINYGLASTAVTTSATAAAGNGAVLSGVSLGLKHAF